MICVRSFSLFLLLLFLSIGAEERASFSMEFNGYLTAQELKEKEQEIHQRTDKGPTDCFIQVGSDGGELSPLLDLASALYEWKQKGDHRILLHIQNQAVGPAAVLPFLADQLYTSVVASWGDIQLDQMHPLPLNLLRSRLGSLLSGDPHQPLLQEVAEAMIDPSIELYLDHGKLLRHSAPGAELLTGSGETLVLHKRQMEALGLLAKGALPSAFTQPLSPQAQVAEEGEIGAPLSHEGIEAELRKHISFTPDGPNLIGLIEIGREGINQSTWIRVRSALDAFRKERPLFLLLHLNTPGGEVFASQQISDGLKEFDTETGIPVIAYIDNWAISAGAMLAYSCRYIAIAKDAAMGAAEPVLMGGAEGPQSASEKINSALRADFANRAAFFDRNPYLAEAMVDSDLILVRRHGEILKLNDEEEIIRGGLHPDEVITTEGKLLTLTARQLSEYGVADLHVPPTPLVPVTAEEEEVGKWPASKLALMHLPFFDEIPNAWVERHQAGWRVTFFSILAQPMVGSLLFLGMMLGFYLEMNTPGFGVAGVIGLVCLFFLLLASFSLQAASWLEVLFLLLGLLLLALEIFVIPGFGIAGVLGILFTLGALLALLLPGLKQIEFSFDTGAFNAAGEEVLKRLAWFGGAILVGVILIIIFSRTLVPKIARRSRLILTGEQEAAQGFVSGPAKGSLPAKGAQGITLTPMRPSGKVEIEGESYEALVEGGSYLSKGIPVIVLRRSGAHLVVERDEKR